VAMPVGAMATLGDCRVRTLHATPSSLTIRSAGTL
jgi:hypothetical protein